MKQCSLCGELKLFDQYHHSKRAKDGLQSRCKSCSIRARIDYYRSNHQSSRKKNNARAARYYQENRKFVTDFLREHPCVDCGESDPIVLEFDHVRGKKRYTVASVMNAVAPATFIKEIGKCDVRCANCHRRKTALEQGWTR